MPEDLEPDKFRRTWDTATVPKRQRFEYYREGVCQAFMSYTPQKPPDGHLEARLDLATVCDASILRTKCTSVSLKRTSLDLASLKEDYVTFGLVLSGCMRARIGNVESERFAGKSKLIDSTRLEAVDISGNFKHITAIFKRSSFTDYVKLIESFDAVSLGSVLDSLMIYIEARSAFASRTELSSLAAATNTLIVSGLIKDKEYVDYRCSSDPSTKSGILQSLKSLIDEELSNSDLTSTNIATRFGLSARYFQKIFHDEGTTFTRYVLDRRLDKIHADLENLTLASVSPALIAFRWGFRDISTFHRNFRRRFGDTPVQCRKRCLERINTRA